MRWIILILLMIGFASAVDIDFDCPDEIFAEEEFECSLEVFDGGGFYDVKIDLDGERDSILEIWDDEDDEWLSGYYYLKDFIEDGEEKDVRLRVSEDGRHDGVLKLRQGDDREDFDVEIDVERAVVFEEVVSDEEVVVLKEKVEVILLNGNTVKEEGEEVVYESKNALVGGWLIYGFALFLIFVIVVLIWERGYASRE